MIKLNLPFWVARSAKWYKTKDNTTLPNSTIQETPELISCGPKDAQLMASDEALFLDIDNGKVHLYPSSTEGHFHLMIETGFLSKTTKDNLVNALHDAGLVGEGNMLSYKKYDTLFLRPPWVVKGEDKSIAQLYEGAEPPKPLESENIIENKSFEVDVDLEW